MSRSVVDLRPVEQPDLEFVAANIREADRVEVYESSRRDIPTGLTNSLRRSDRTMTICVDGEPVAVCGVGRLSLMSDVGVPWMLGTNKLSRHAKVLLPYAPVVVRRMMQSHSVLRNLVHDDNKVSIRWLRSLGFRMGEPVPAGWRGAMFRIFELTEGELNV